MQTSTYAIRLIILPYLVQFLALIIMNVYNMLYKVHSGPQVVTWRQLLHRLVANFTNILSFGQLMRLHLSASSSNPEDAWLMPSTSDA